MGLPKDARLTEFLGGVEISVAGDEDDRQSGPRPPCG